MIPTVAEVESRFGVGELAPDARLYNDAWFIGFFLSGALYSLLMLGHARPLATITN